MRAITCPHPASLSGLKLVDLPRPAPPTVGVGVTDFEDRPARGEVLSWRRPLPRGHLFCARPSRDTGPPR
jgi:hypothetical protein